MTHNPAKDSDPSNESFRREDGKAKVEHKLQTPEASREGIRLTWKWHLQGVPRTTCGLTSQACDPFEPGGDAYRFKRNQETVIKRKEGGKNMQLPTNSVR